ncbi:MAG: hypothetical protein IGQ45_08235 [Cyanobacterium sp. T60_A2020_053]|nr:hypothetical protein [Cyanobacterium sp. T60_A2020_053]
MSRFKHSLSTVIFSHLDDFSEGLFSSAYFRPTAYFLLGLTGALGDKSLVSAVMGAGFLLFFLYNYPRFSFSSSLFNYIFSPRQRHFSLTVLASATGAVLIYFCMELYQHIDNSWLTSALLLQSIISISTLIFLGWFFLNNKSLNNSPKTKFTELIFSLSSDAPLQRLYGLNQINSYWQSGNFTLQEIIEIREYLQVMKQIETDLTIKNKILLLLETMVEGADYQKINNVNYTVKKPLSIKNKSLQTIVIK